MSDRNRAGNPGRRGYATGPTPTGRVISDSDLGGPDYTRAPRSSVGALGGPARAGSRAANITDADEPVRPDLRRSDYWPEQPDGRTVRRLKKGGPVKKAAKSTKKSKR